MLTAKTLHEAIEAMRQAASVLDRIYTRDGIQTSPDEVGRTKARLQIFAGELLIESGMHRIEIEVQREEA